ncbi:MAG: carbohydrate binding domain-containing protein [Nitrososphaerales archaeon]
MASARKLLVATALAQGSSNIYRYVLDNDTPLTRTAIVLGLGGYLTRADDAAAEPGKRTTIKASGYFDTSATAGTIVSKGSDFAITTKPGAIDGSVYAYTSVGPTDPAQSSSQCNPTGSGAYSELTVTGAPTGWQAVSDGSDSTYLAGGSTYKRSTFTANFASIPAGTLVVGVTVYARVRVTSNYSNYANLLLYLNGTLASSSNIGMGTSFGWISAAVGRPGGGSWSPADFSSLQIGVGLYIAQESAMCSELYAIISYVYPPIAYVSPKDTTLQYDYTANLAPNSSFENGNPPTSWSIYGTGASYSRSNAQYRIGSYSLALTRNGNDCGVWASIGGTELQGKTITVGAWVYATVANAAKVVVTDNAGNASGSAYHSGASRWEFLTASVVIGSTATNPTMNLLVNNTNTTAYFDGAVAVVGYEPPSSRLKIGGYENLLVNGDFELCTSSGASTQLIENWTAYQDSGTVSVQPDSTTAKAGTYSAKIITSSGSSGGLLQVIQAGASVSAPRQVAFGVWGKASSGAQWNLAVSGSNTGAVFSPTQTGDGQWHWVEFTATVKDNTLGCYIRLVSASSTLNVDLATVQFGTTITPTSPTIPDAGYDSFIPDGNFESGITGWSASGGTISASTDRAKIGSYSLKGVNPGGATHFYRYDLYSKASYGLLTGRTVTFGAWVWASVANKVRVFISLGDGNHVSSSLHPGDSTWVWLSVSRTVQTPYDAWANVGLEIQDGGGTAYMDGAVFGYNVPSNATDLPAGFLLTLPADSGIPDNSANWNFMSAATPYLRYIDHQSLNSRYFYHNDTIIGYASASAGTVSTTAGSNVVTGTGTSWDSRNTFGRMYITGYGYGVIDRVISNTSLLLKDPVTVTLTGATYTIKPCVWNVYGSFASTAPTALEIVWGANPSNVLTSLGPLQFTTAVGVAPTSTPGAPNIVRGVTGTTGPESEPVNPNFPLYGVFALMASLLGVSTKTMINIGVIFLMLGVGTTCIATRVSPLITSGVLILLYIILNIMHIVDYWMVFMLVSLLLLAWLLPRQTSYI